MKCMLVYDLPSRSGVGRSGVGGAGAFWVETKAPRFGAAVRRVFGVPEPLEGPALSLLEAFVDATLLVPV